MFSSSWILRGNIIVWWITSSKYNQLIRLIFIRTYYVLSDCLVYVCSYVVERLNVNPYGSSITLLAARDGSVMVNRTFYTTDLFAKWNVTTHSSGKLSAIFCFEIHYLYIFLFGFS